MTRPVVGVIGGEHLIENRHAAQRVGERNLRAVAEVAGALPLMFAGAPDLTDIADLLATVDGVLLTGARANVHPSRYGVEPDARYEPYDARRDALALSLAAACVERGVPLLGICRGVQEINVAFGGTLHPEIRDLPGRLNHRMPRLENGEVHPDIAYVFADRHDVHLIENGAFAKLFGRDTIRVTNRESVSSSKASPRTARLRRSASPRPLALRSAFSGTPSMTHRRTRSTKPFSRRLALPPAPTSGQYRTPALPPPPAWVGRTRYLRSSPDRANT